jgi:hypothetical protein
VAFRPKEQWRWFKNRLLGKYVDSRVIIKVNEMFLNQNVVYNDDLVPNLVVGRDLVLALVILGVFIYIYILTKIKKK